MKPGISLAVAASALTLAAACAQEDATARSPGSAPEGADAPPVSAAIDAVTARAVARLESPEGEPRGSVSFMQTPAGVVVTARLTGLPEGAHGFHIHAVGACSPDFAAAKGHFAPSGNAHGFLSVDGPHAGDMTNVHVDADGDHVVEILNPRISLLEGAAASLFDDDGSTLMIHAGPDDYFSQPSGAAGARLACGVIERTE